MNDQITYRGLKGSEINIDEYDSTLRFLDNEIKKAQSQGFITQSEAWSIGGMDVRAYATNYPILTDFYTAAPVTLTLAAANVTYPRLDAIVADIQGNISILQGAPAAVAVEPIVPVSTHFLIRYLLIPANAATPIDPETNEGTTDTLVLYKENTGVAGNESDVAVSNAAIVPGSVNTPLTDVYSIEASNVQKLHETTFTFPTLQNIKQYTSLNFTLKLKAVVNVNKFWFVRFYKNGVNTRSFLFQHNQYGFNANNLETQYISIPVNDIDLPKYDFDKIALFFLHEANTIPGYWLDNIEFVNGFLTNPNNPPSENHTHNNKTILDQIDQKMVDLMSKNRFIEIGSTVFRLQKNETPTPGVIEQNDLLYNGLIKENSTEIIIQIAKYTNALGDGNTSNFGTIANNFTDGNYSNVIFIILE